MSFFGRSFPETTTNRLDGEDEQKDVRVEVEEERGKMREESREEIDTYL